MVARRGKILFRTAEGVHAVRLTTRDVHLLDGQHFFRDGWSYRELFALDFIRGLKSPPLDVPLARHEKIFLVVRLQSLLSELETQKDLISCDYSYNFDDDRKTRSSAGRSGFRVDGGYGYIDARPAGYCDLTVSDIGPNGRGRVVAIFDMRVRRQIETFDRGLLKIYSRKAQIGWFEEIEKLLKYLGRQSADTIEVMHSVDA